MTLLDFCYEIMEVIKPFLIGLLGIEITAKAIRIILDACRGNWITEEDEIEESESEKEDEIEKSESENIDEDLKRYFNYKEEK